MARQILKGLTMLTLIAGIAFVSAVLTANGQSNNLVAQIPFDFIVGDKTLASGEYRVRAMTNAGDALMIKSADAKASAIRLTDATGSQKSQSQGRLVFHRYGDRYFLSEVWSAGATTGRQLRKSRQERAIERELATIPSSNPAVGGYELVEILATVR